MTALLIDGNALSKTLRGQAAERAAALTARGHQPGLAVILVGENPASEVYVRNKIKACEDNGFFSLKDAYPATLSEADLLARIDELNRDPKIHGILVQLPLPAHIDSHKVIEAIAPEKDVDGFHVANAGALMTGKPLFRPCTPYGVMKMFEAHGIALQGANAVVIGRSNIVGKPMAMMLLDAGATVTICHSKTRDLAAHTREADIVVAAVGKRCSKASTPRCRCSPPTKPSCCSRTATTATCSAFVRTATWSCRAAASTARRRRPTRSTWSTRSRGCRPPR